MSQSSWIEINKTALGNYISYRNSYLTTAGV